MGHGASPCWPKQKHCSDTRQRRRRRGSESLSLRRNDDLSVFVDERRALAWVDAQDGRLTDAIAELWAAADMALERGQRCFEAVILDDLMRLGDGEAATRARDVSEVCRRLVGRGRRASTPRPRWLKRGKDFEAAASSFSQIDSSLIASELWAAASAAYRT